MGIKEINSLSYEKLQNQAELLERIAQGEQEAFRILCKHYRPILYTVVFRFTSEQWMADEIVQDSFLKIWLKRSELSEIGNFRGWLYKVASNLAVNAVKKSRRDKLKIENWLEIASYNADTEDFFSKENEVYWRILTAAIERLPPRQRETFHLIKEQNMKRGDAAKILQVSPETVKWNLEQALRNVRAYCMLRMDELSILIVFLLMG